MRNQKGFTLIELAIVITILGILAIVVIPKYQDLTREARIAANQGVLGGFKSGCYIYYAKHLGKFPAANANGMGANADSVLNELPTGWHYTESAAGTPQGPGYLGRDDGTDSISYSITAADSANATFTTIGTYW